MVRAWVGLAVGLAALGTAHAAPRVIAVQSDGCPDADETARGIRALLPTEARGDAPVAVAVVVRDEGPRYRVLAAGSERVLEDLARRCSDRAHAAAVVAALLLAPPALRPPPLPWQARLFVDLIASGRLELAPSLGSGGLLVTGGGELRLEAGVRPVAVSLALRGLGPMNARFAVGGAELTRIPVDLGLRLGWRRRRIELGGLVGLTTAALRIEGSGLAPAHADTRVDLAVHLVLAVRWWFGSRVGIEATGGLDVSSRPVDLTIDPVGMVGRTPRLWIGFGLGTVFRLRNPERD